MGVEGLLTFIRSNDDLLIKGHRLYQTKIVVDSSNLTSHLIRRIDRYRRSDLVDVDLVKFERKVERFIESLQKCNIEPIFVFDGDQPKRPIKPGRRKNKRPPKCNEKETGRTESNDENTASEIQLLREIFKSVAKDKKTEIVQCLDKADEHVARLSNEYECPAVSSDSDFFILDMKNGLLPIEMLNYERVRYSVSRKTISGGEKTEQPIETSDPYFYIECCLFTQDNFIQFFPNLDKRCLPLLGILAGNDTVSKRKFSHLTDLLPVKEITEKSGLDIHLLKLMKCQQLKILKTLYFLCGKSLEQNINLLVAKVTKDKRRDLKAHIKECLNCYNLSDCGKKADTCDVKEVSSIVPCV